MLFPKQIISILFVTVFLTTAVYAADYSDIQLLIKDNKFEQALQLTEGQLANNDNDIKLYFLKGLILTRLERLPDAEAVFKELTRRNPELPEPYNNLAVVYAAQGKYTEAEQALKDAINTHPSYATAHENLGDIYAKMASRAYNQALELDTNNNSARSKLSLVNELISDTSETTASKKEQQVAAAAPVKKTVEKKPVPTEPEIITIPVKKQEAPEKKEKIVSPPAEKQEDTVAVQLTDNREAVDNAIKSWARAWSAQNVEAYLASYADDYVPDDGQSLSAWKAERKRRLRRPDYIKVDVSNIKINLHGPDYAEVRFKQRYQSDTYADIVTKELLLRKYDDKWLITQETTR